MVLHFTMLRICISADNGILLIRSTIEYDKGRAYAISEHVSTLEYTLRVFLHFIILRICISVDNGIVLIRSIIEYDRGQAYAIAQHMSTLECTYRSARVITTVIKHAYSLSTALHVHGIGVYMLFPVCSV